MTTAREAQVARNAKYDALTAKVKDKVCAACDSYPFVAWIAGSYVLRCNCYPKPPTLASEYERTVGRRQWNMTTRALATLDEHGIKAVNAEEMAQEVRALLPGSTKATDSEIRLFVRFCLSLGANPFVKEAYLIKYQDGQPASVVLGLRWKLKQAAKNAAYEGYKAGIIVQGEGPLEYREGAFALPTEKVVGGWCEVHRNGWAVAPRHAVSMTEYFAGGRQYKNLWDTKPHTMIMKVAISQAIERAFPEEASVTERSIAQANIRVMDEGQAGVDLEDARSSLSDDAAPVTARGDLPVAETTTTPPAPKGAGIATVSPKRTSQSASDEFWPKVRQGFPSLTSFQVLEILKVKQFTDWKGTVDEALTAVEAKAKQATGG